jgi:uncharacterized oxidoreductase
MRTTGNTVLITGGTSGIGLGLAERFLSTGNEVIICGRRRDRLEAIGRRNPGIATRVCDIADERQRQELAAWAIREHPAVNVLVNNAGIQLLADLAAPDLARVRAEVETNLIAPLHLAGLFAAALAGRSPAAIVNISSGLAFAPIASMPVYCATKAAIHSLSLSLRRQLRDTGVKVFEIIPPSVDTELGGERREAGRSHGGMAVADFVEAALRALANDELEAAIGGAADLRAGRESLFDRMNR